MTAVIHLFSTKLVVVAILPKFVALTVFKTASRLMKEFVLASRFCVVAPVNRLVELKLVSEQPLLLLHPLATGLFPLPPLLKRQLPLVE